MRGETELSGARVSELAGELSRGVAVAMSSRDVCGLDEGEEIDVGTV